MRILWTEEERMAKQRCFLRRASSSWGRLRGELALKSREGRSYAVVLGNIWSKLSLGYLLHCNQKALRSFCNVQRKKTRLRVSLSRATESPRPHAERPSEARRTGRTREHPCGGTLSSVEPTTKRGHTIYPQQNICLPLSPYDDWWQQ